MAKIHITLQGKGGVGKSFVSSLIAQNRLEKNGSIMCFDTDPINTTFSGYKFFATRQINLVKDNQIDSSEYDELMDLIVNHNNNESDVVIDNGASSFMPLSKYLIENDVFKFLKGRGYQTIIHSVITGGQALSDTITGLDKLITQYPESVSIIVWINQYFGEVNFQGKLFEDINLYNTNKDRIKGIIYIDKQNDLFHKDLKEMLEKRLAFDEAINQSTDFNFMAKNRLGIIKNQLWEKMNNIFDSF